MEPNLGDTCRQHLAFMQWADDLMLAAVAEHAPENISVLQHIYLGEDVWLRRVQGDREIQITQLQPPPDVAALANAWPALHQEWTDWAASVSDWSVLIPHRNLKGDHFNMPAWQIALHLVNHGSFHRGQVAAALRAVGFAPPATDLIVFYRSRPAA